MDLAKRFRNKYHGFIQVYKPVGITSHDVIDRLRGILNQKKIGHTGTLDLLAEGLMVVCLGRATKASRFVTNMYKTYEAEICLGVRSKTFDREGIEEDTEPKGISKITKKQIDEAVKGFIGHTKQTVPLYSAVRINGERLYKLARKGMDVDLPVREIEITDLKLLEYSKPMVKIEVSCSSGTYIRSLAHDLGETLGCGAYLHSLKRTRIGDMTLDDAFSFDEIEHLHKKNQLDLFILTYKHVLNYASLSVSSSYRNLVINGKALYLDDIHDTIGDFESGDMITIKDDRGEVLAIGRAELSSAQIRKHEHNRRIFSYIKVFHH